MSVHRMIIKDDVLALVAAGYCHRVLRGGFLPSSSESRAFFDGSTDTFLVVLCGLPGDGKLAVYIVSAHEERPGQLLFEVLPVGLTAPPDMKALMFSGVEVRDRLWLEEDVDYQRSSPTLDPDRQN